MEIMTKIRYDLKKAFLKLSKKSTLSCSRDIIKCKHFLHYWPFVRGIYRSSVNSPHKGQWHRALMFPLIGAIINGWVNNHEAGDLRCHLAHYDPLVMPYGGMEFGQSWLRYWLGAIGHQAITWTKIDQIQRWIYVDLSSVLGALLHSHEGSFNCLRYKSVFDMGLKSILWSYSHISKDTES